MPDKGKRSQGRLTVDKPSTHLPREPMPVTGTTEHPLTGVTIHAGGHQHHATSGPDGRYGATIIAPDTPGVHTISVESTEATTTTTFAVKPRPKR